MKDWIWKTETPKIKGFEFGGKTFYYSSKLFRICALSRMWEGDMDSKSFYLSKLTNGVRDKDLTYLSQSHKDYLLCIRLGYGQ